MTSPEPTRSSPSEAMRHGREAEAQASVEAETGEFANLYPISGFESVNGVMPPAALTSSWP